MAGKLIIFSAPSGSGKSTIINFLLKQNLNLHFSISATSRAPRGTEKDGVEYYFLTPDEFRARIRAGLVQIEGPGPALIVAHSGTAREIFTLLGLPFERPDNCDILHFQVGHDCHWTVRKL